MIPVSSTLQKIVFWGVLITVLFLVWSFEHGGGMKHNAAAVANRVNPNWWRDEYPKPEIRAQAPAERAHYTVAQATPSPTPACQECQERKERYRAAELNPEIIIKPARNTLVIGTR